MDDQNNPQPNLGGIRVAGELQKKEKLAFLGLVILAVLIVYLGFRQMGNNLKTPFALFALKYSGGAEQQQTDAQQIEELKKKDTDKDGLSDYDELYIYNTSPYLADSDSDGISDFDEVRMGTDPNCPKGQNCYSNEIANSTSGQITTTTLEDTTANIPSADQLVLQDIFSQNPDPKQIREFLLQNGGDKNILDNFSDEELTNFFKEFISSPTSTLNTASAESGLKTFNDLLSATNENTGTIDPAKIDLNALRQSLKDKGVPEDTLKQLDDKTLMDLIKQVQ